MKFRWDHRLLLLVAVFLFIALANSPSSISTAILPSELEDVNVQYDDISSSNNTTIYSAYRFDRSGAAVHDMLMAHAYAFSINKTYGGACPVKYLARKDTVFLLNKLSLSNILRIACPKGEKNSGLVVPDVVYRKFDNSTFTESWREMVHDQMPRSKRLGNFTKIVVHIRRGDVDPCRHEGRYLPNYHYLKLIEAFLPPDSKVQFNVTIYSESQSVSSFEVFHKLNYTVKLDTELPEVWGDMMSADVLILSKSSFSFVPALLNPNTVVYTQFWHNPIETWKIVSKDLIQNSTNFVTLLRQEICSTL